MKNKLFKSTFTLLIVLLVLYVAEIKLYLTWVYWWYDIVLHFLGGLISGLLILVFLQYFFNLFEEKKFKILLIVLFGTFAIGMIWEIYEVYFDLVSLADYTEYLIDTRSDLFLDVFGSFLSFIYFNKVWRKN